MNIEEVRKNAPEGATHYCGEPYIGYFYFDFQWFTGSFSLFDVLAFNNKANLYGLLYR